MIKKIQMGKLLLEKKLLTQEQIDTAIIRQSINGQKFGKVLIDLGFISENKLLTLLSEQLEIPLIDLKHYALDTQVVSLLPKAIARRLQCIILKKEDNNFLIGMVDPEDRQALDELALHLKKPVEIAIVRESELMPLLDRLYINY